MIYRICTEDKNRATVERIVSGMFAAFTITEGTGYWHGIREKAITIDIAVLEHPDVPYRDVVFYYKFLVDSVAKQIKAVNDQEAVLIEEITSTNTLV